jgi:hypothetical protein
LLEAQFDNVFAPKNDLLEVGIPGPTGYSITFDSTDAVIAYWPTNGTHGALTADLLAPVTSAAGALGGEVLIEVV